MSRTISEPIPIENFNKNYSQGKQKFDNIYNFKLITKINNENIIFTSLENKKYSNLIKYSNKIKYEDINDFEIEIDLLDNKFSLIDNINHHSSCYSTQNNNIYIEFSQDTHGYVNCICYFIDKDFNILCISPPN